MTHISLDHDLALWDDSGKEINGMLVIDYLEEQAYTNDDFIPPHITIHSENWARRPIMERIARKLNERKEATL